MRPSREEERRRGTDGEMEMDEDSESGRRSVHLALSLNQHSKLTVISVGFINMESH